jgi:outer membrane protein assembly factor BamD (BamD/ComL family)
MGKKIRRLLHGKAVLIPLLGLCAFGIIAATIAIAGSGSGTSSSVSAMALSKQKQLVLDSIAKNDRKAADESFKKLTELEKNDALAEAVYSIGTVYQYKNWDAARANSAHKFVIENFPNSSKFVLLSSVELIRSQLRSGKNADEAVAQWMNTYKNRTEFASELPNAIYLIAQAYSNNKKDEKANPLFQYVASTYTKTIYGTLSQMRIDAINKEYDAADVVGDYLIAHSKDNSEVEKAIKSLAEYYRTKKEYDRSIHFYTSIIDNYENIDDPVKPYREAIYSYIDKKDDKNARDLIEEMQKTLDGNKGLARANFDIANYFLKAGDSLNGLKLHAYNVEKYTSSLESLWSEAAIIWHHIREGDEENASIEYAKMLDTYKSEKTIPKEIFQIADIYTEIGNTTKARELHNYVITQWPNSEFVFNAKTGLIKADIKDGKDTEALAGIDSLITDYKDRRELPATVFLLGEDYWNQSRQEFAKANPVFQGRKSVPTELVKERLFQAKTVWEKIINQLPDSNTKAQAYKFAAMCYQDLDNGELAIAYYQTVVDKWPGYADADSCLFMIGRVYRSLIELDIKSASDTEPLMEKAYRNIVTNYPDSRYTQSAQKWLVYYEKKNQPRKKGSKEEFNEFLKTVDMTKYIGGEK